VASSIGQIEKFSLAALVSGQENKKHVIGFNSSINTFNLERLESRLRDLKSPEWPFCRNDKNEYYLPEPRKNVSPSDPKYCPGNDKRFNEEQRYQGELIYIDRCQSCHTVVDRSAWDRIVVGHMSDADTIGTDPAMAENSVKHNGKSGNFKDTYQAVEVGHVIVKEDAPVVQILTSATKGVIATPDADKWWPAGWSNGSTPWSCPSRTTRSKRASRTGLQSGHDIPTLCQPPCIQGPLAERHLGDGAVSAQRLRSNFVGSSASRAQRPKSFKVGAREFDPEKVGFRSAGYDGTPFNTDTQRGNHNTGHDMYCLPNEKEIPDKGCLTDEQRWDLIEYLKSL